MSDLKPSALRFDPLTFNPFIQIRNHKPNLGSSEFHEGNTSVLDETSDKPLGAPEAVSSARHVHEKSINVQVS